MRNQEEVSDVQPKNHENFQFGHWNNRNDEDDTGDDDEDDEWLIMSLKINL